jgi:hypothetical protein
MRKDLFFLFLFDPFRAYTAVHSKLISVFKSLNTLYMSRVIHDSWFQQLASLTRLLLSVIELDGVEGIKACQTASHSVGRAWQQGKGKALATRCVGSLFVVYLCVSALLCLLDA